LGIVFSTEGVFTLFIFAGYYKADPRLSWIPIDLTLLFLLIGMIAATWVCIRNNFSFNKSAFLLASSICLFLIWMIITIGWTPSNVYGPNKALELGTLVLWAAIVPALIIAPCPIRFNRFANAVMIFGGIVSVSAFVRYQQVGSNYGASENYLILGRVAGFAIAIAIVQLSVSGALFKKICMAFLVLFCFFLLWTAGARGPFLSAIGSILVLMAGSVHLRKGTIRRRLGSAFIVLGIVGAIVAVSIPESRTLDRLTTIFSGQSYGRSAGTRIEYYGASVDLMARAPLFGSGVGSWPIEMGLPDVRVYPHNIVLETLIEGGIVGMFLLVVAAGFGFRLLFAERVFDDPMKLTALLLFVNTLINAQTTGDLTDNRLFFASIGLLAVGAASANRRRHSKQP
jgi:O-antigen ligase